MRFNTSFLMTLLLSFLLSGCGSDSSDPTDPYPEPRSNEEPVDDSEDSMLRVSSLDPRISYYDVNPEEIFELTLEVAEKQSLCICFGDGAEDDQELMVTINGVSEIYISDTILESFSETTFIDINLYNSTQVKFQLVLQWY